MIRVFRISQKKMGENGEIIRFLCFFYEIVRFFLFFFFLEDLWGAYEWTWDIVDFFLKEFTVPFKVIARNFRNSK